MSTDLTRSERADSFLLISNLNGCLKINKLYIIYILLLLLLVFTNHNSICSNFKSNYFNFFYFTYNKNIFIFSLKYV
jgi:hypothetical protein